MGCLIVKRMIAVEEGLQNVRRVLEDEGYRVVELDESRIDEAEAVVISGMDENFLQDQAIETMAPVINAEGKSADQILKELRRRLD
jgi:hypothetical protein